VTRPSIFFEFPARFWSMFVLMFMTSSSLSAPDTASRTMANAQMEMNVGNRKFKSNAV